MKAVCYARYSSAFTLYAKRRLDGVEESELKLDELAKTKIQPEVSILQRIFLFGFTNAS